MYFGAINFPVTPVRDEIDTVTLDVFDENRQMLVERRERIQSMFF